MKIPYIKLYTADLLALSRYVTSEQLGDAIVGVCELAFENDTAYQPETTREKNLFEMLNHWKEESYQGIEQKKKAGRMGAKKKWQKQKSYDVSAAITTAIPPLPKHTDTETETETKTDTDTETENISLSSRACAQERERDFSKESSYLPADFADQVIARFENTVKTQPQREIFIRNNTRYLKDILAFCEGSVPLALQTISVCIDRLQQGGVTGGYGAVCRNLPEYYEKAKAQLAQQAHE